MADYIYLLQNRLAPSQWRALEAVREAARAHTMSVFLVGGAVRDLTSGSPVRDLDFAVQGDAGVLVQELQSGGATLAGENKTTGSVYLTFRGGVRVEIGPTLTVHYPKPGQPEVQSAVILDDLRRRDFTANAMAVSLNEGSYGLLLDPLNGTADIENRELRLVSAYGFIEQPALLLRVARLSERLGWSLEERTQSRYETSKEEGHIQALAPVDRGYELEEIFHEEDPVAVLEHMATEGWGETLFPSLQAKDADADSVDEVRELLGQLEGQGLHPDPSAVLFPFVTARMSEANRTALKKLFARQGFVQQIESLETRGKDLAGQITSKAVAQPSDTWKLLMDADPEVLLWLAQHSRSAAVQGKIKSFLKDWPQMRQRIPYALMQEMRITPELPVYDKLLDDLFFALIDGKLETTEATRAFLEPYSPPAPPQVAVRRRAAKATRGRGKRAQENLVDRGEDESNEVDETEQSNVAAAGDGDTRGSDADDAEEEEETAPKSIKAEPKKGRPVAAKADASHPAAASTPVSAGDAVTSVPAKEPGTKAAAKADTSQAVVKAKASSKDAAPAPPAAPGTKESVPNNIPSAKNAPAKTSAKAAETKKPASKDIPAKTSPKAVVPAKAVVAKKGSPSAKASKPVKKAVAPAKRPPAPVKVAAKKSATTVRGGGKPAAKSGSGKSAGAAKKVTPLKAVAKKTAAKGKGRR